jgi:alpha-glucoside transport system substrate-binding protein
MTDTPSYFPVLDAVTDFGVRRLGTDYDFFLLPPIDKAYGAPAQVEGHVISMLHDTPEARALMKYVASGAQGEAWVKQVGLGTSPRKGAKLEWHTTPLGHKVGEVIQQADKMRMPAYDLIPWEVNVQMGLSLMDYVAGTSNLDAALKKIDDTWAASG